MGTREDPTARKTCMWETTAHANVRGDLLHCLQTTRSRF